MIRSTHYLFTLVVLAFCASTAFAATPILTVTRSMGSGAEKASALVGYHFQSIASEDSDMQVIAPAKVLSNQDTRDFAAAAGLVSKGRTAYESLDLDAALQYFEYALARYQRDLAYLTQVKEVSNVLLLMAATHILRGEEKAGTERLAQALEIYPKAEPDPRIYNPAMRKIFDDVSQNMQKRGMGKIIINSTPSYAEVYIDGIFKGITPLNVEGLIQGQHIIQVQKPGYEPTGTMLAVQSKSEIPFNASLKALARSDDFDRLAEKTVAASVANPRKVDASMFELAQLTGATYLLLSSVHIEGDKIQVDASLYDTHEEKRLGTDSTIFSILTKPEDYRPEIKALYEKLKKGVVHEKRITATQKPTAKDRVTTSDKPCEGFFCSNYNVLAVSLIAGGVALMGGGTAFWFLAKDKNDTYREDAVQISATAEDIRSQGKTYGILGDTLMFAGGAAAVSGALMLVIPLFKKSDNAKASLENENPFNVSAVALPGGGFINTSLKF